MAPSKWIVGTLLAAATLEAPSALACGGFFCGRQPVDQTAERILFEVGADSVTMTTQISFNGAAPDFAWILPLNAVPDPDSLSVFPQRALTALDANTGPTFFEPCSQPEFEAGGDSSGSTDGGGVTVHIRAEVGDYDVAVIESSDPEALISWLRAEEFRVTPPMEPYIRLYTDEGMKFLALKLLQTADVKDLKPFRFTLPGTSPSIPLRMTSLAAEPEMSIVVFLLSDQRYEAKNWENVTIDDRDVRFAPNTWPLRTNWTSLVAKGVDLAGGQGWVTEFAGTTESFVTQLETQIANANFATEDDEVAAQALLDVMQAHPYLTRFYSRLSAEEMTSDPVFGRSAGDDVSQFHDLSLLDDGVDLCSVPTASVDPCEFVTCGAGGTCRTALVDDGSGGSISVTGCACVPGATARTTFAPDGTATVICQDARMSFLNPGDQEAGTQVLPDPCVDFDCGERGSCLAVNMTPTCVCDEGYVAIGSFTASGQRETTCVAPEAPIEETFYAQRLPALPDNLPGGREVALGSGGSAGAMSSSGGAGQPGSGGTSTGEPGASDGDSGCSCRTAQSTRGTGAWWFPLAGLGLWLGRRRRQAAYAALDV